MLNIYRYFIWAFLQFNFRHTQQCSRMKNQVRNKKVVCLVREIN